MGGVLCPLPLLPPVLGRSELPLLPLPLMVRMLLLLLLMLVLTLERLPACGRLVVVVVVELLVLGLFTT